MGVYTKAMPAKVNMGLACNQPPPLHEGGTSPIMEPLEWRMATPLGRPVVPEVYKMSARSSSSRGTCMASRSPEVTSDQLTTCPDERAVAPEVASTTMVSCSRAAPRAVATNGPSATTAVAPECASMRPTSAGASRGFMGTATPPARWAAV